MNTEPSANPGIDDPTSTESLQALKHDILTEAPVQSRLAHLKGKKVGLVLSGGGGKGAYEAGAILALFDCGIKNFCSIAGTSVGALNAALCHQLCRTGDRNFLLQIWSNISFTKVMSPSTGIIFKIIIYLLATIHVLHNFSDLVDKHSNLDVELYGIEALMISIRRSMLILAAACLGITILFFSVLLVNLLIGTLLGGVINVILALFLVYVIASFISRLWGPRLSLISNARLRKMIETIDIDSIIREPPPIACTVSKPVNFYSIRRQPPTPIYADLSKMADVQEAADLLMQTAAIPEVFPARKVRGGYYVDGGVADNTPILGVADERPDAIVIVYLNHRYRRLSNLRVYEAVRLSEISNTQGVDWEGGFAAWFRKVEILSIIPSENLGGLYKGTLNFNTEKSRKLVALGYKDTLLQLQTLGRD